MIMIMQNYKVIMRVVVWAGVAMMAITLNARAQTPAQLSPTAPTASAGVDMVFGTNGFGGGFGLLMQPYGGMPYGTPFVAPPMVQVPAAMDAPDLSSAGPQASTLDDAVPPEPTPAPVSIPAQEAALPHSQISPPGQPDWVKERRAQMDRRRAEAQMRFAASRVPVQMAPAGFGWGPGPGFAPGFSPGFGPNAPFGPPYGYMPQAQTMPPIEQGGIKR